MTPPLLSIVIPTYGRPEYLPLAIDSALRGMPDVEVLVVPNGADDSWRVATSRFTRDNRVRVESIVTAHANAARNHGLNLARGKYVRFLDDDDLIGEGASSLQCDLLEVNGAELCSGAVELVDHCGNPFRLWQQPDTCDFVTSVLSPKRVAHLAAHVFRRDSLDGLHWDESISLGQDTHWIHQYCRAGERKWVRTDALVGTWRHHQGPRISASSRKAQHMKVSVQYLLDTVRSLQAQHRLDQDRAAVAAAGLWHLIHASFFMDPNHWTRVLHTTQELFPSTYPDLPLYRHPLGRLMPPLLLESLMLPKRRINHAARVRKFKRDAGGTTLPP